MGFPWNTVLLENWPLCPIALSGATYFVLSQGYTLLGVAEDPRDYIDYCQKNGAFRTTMISVPTRAEALRDAAALRASFPWSQIEWKDSGINWSYEISEEWTWRFIEAQAESIE